MFKILYLVIFFLGNIYEVSILCVLLGVCDTLN